MRSIVDELRQGDADLVSALSEVPRQRFGIREQERAGIGEVWWLIQDMVGSQNHGLLRGAKYKTALVFGIQNGQQFSQPTIRSAGVLH